MIAEATASPPPFTAIIVHSRSHFFRNVHWSFSCQLRLKKSWIRLISITQLTADDGTGDLMSTMISAFDEYQSAENAKHIRRAMQENARQGRWNSSTPPFGFQAVATGQAGTRERIRKRLEIDPVDAEIVGKVYDLYLRGRDDKLMGMKAIAAHLNEWSISMHGRRWRIQNVNSVLSDPLYTRCFYFNRRDSRTGRLRPESEWIAVEIPAIVAADLFERVARRRAANDSKMHAPRALSSPTPLVGLLKCAHCGAGMSQASGKSGKYRYYK